MVDGRERTHGWNRRRGCAAVPIRSGRIELCNPNGNFGWPRVDRIRRLHLGCSGRGCRARRGRCARPAPQGSRERLTNTDRMALGFGPAPSAVFGSTGVRPSILRIGMVSLLPCEQRDTRAQFLAQHGGTHANSQQTHFIARGCWCICTRHGWDRTGQRCRWLPGWMDGASRWYLPDDRYISCQHRYSGRRGHCQCRPHWWWRWRRCGHVGVKCWRCGRIGALRFERRLQCERNRLCSPRRRWCSERN